MRDAERVAELTHKVGALAGALPDARSLASYAVLSYVERMLPEDFEPSPLGELGGWDHEGALLSIVAALGRMAQSARVGANLNIDARAVHQAVTIYRTTLEPR